MEAVCDSTFRELTSSELEVVCGGFDWGVFWGAVAGGAVGGAIVGACVGAAGWRLAGAAPLRRITPGSSACRSSPSTSRMRSGPTRPDVSGG